MSRHTPGEWRVYNGWVHPGFDGPGPETTNGDTAICEPLGPDKEANAHLIAAAPELLEALRWYAEQVEDLNRNTWAAEKALGVLRADRGKKALAVIAKAKGEEHE